MTSEELNLRLLECFPEITDMYQEETSWQDGDDTGSHIVYADVFVPFVKGQIINKNEQMLAKVFDYIENLLKLEDEYVNEVVALSFLESLLYNEEVDNEQFIQFAKHHTLQLLEEIVQGIEK